MKDKNGNDINVGDILFYSERPYSNHADAIVVVYDHLGVAKVGTIIINGLSGGYENYERKPDQDLELLWYGMDSALKQTEFCHRLELIEGVSESDITIDFANEIFPLTAPSEKIASGTTMVEIKIKSVVIKNRKIIKFWDNRYRYERMIDGTWSRFSAYSADTSYCSSNDIIEVLEAFNK